MHGLLTGFVHPILGVAFTFTPDAAKSLAMLAASETSWNQTWHVPTAAQPPTGKEFIRHAATRFGVEPR